MGNQGQGASGDQAEGKNLCRARTLGAGGLVECLAEVESCKWHLPFGMGLLCKHPLNQTIAQGELTTGWSVGNTETR